MGEIGPGLVHPQVYPPSEDSRLLLAAALREVRPGDRVLEIGTGSGYITAHLAGQCRSLLATDVSPHAVRQARKSGIEVVRTDLFAGICGKFDLIIFNPPYLPTAPHERIDDWLEHALDGGAAGRSVIERFVRGAGRVLTAGGRILLLCSSLTGIGEVRETFARQGFICFVVGELALEDELLVVLRAVPDLCHLPAR